MLRKEVVDLSKRILDQLICSWKLPWSDFGDHTDFIGLWEGGNITFDGFVGLDHFSVVSVGTKEGDICFKMGG